MCYLHAVWPSPYSYCVIMFAPTGVRPHPYLNKLHPKLRVHVPGVFEHPVNPLLAFMPAWRPWFKCNKELSSASESCVPAVQSTAAFPGSKSVCNAWSDAHWQPAQTFPAWLQRLQRQGEIPAAPLHV